MNTLNWMVREENRFHTGEYQPIPVEITSILAHYGVTLERFHFAHLAVKVAGNVAFIENSDKGERDIQATMKLGKYLTRFYGGMLPGPVIAQCSTILRGMLDKPVLQIAREASDIVRVYVNGPHSCMAEEADHPKFECSPYHPTEVYAGPDTAIGYIMRDNRITARTVLNMKDKTYVRLYGDEENLRAALIDAGYSKGDLDGCRLLRLDADCGEVVCPYLDGSANEIEIGSNYLYVSTYGGEYIAETETGLLVEADCIGHCECCESRIGEYDDYVSVGDYSGELVCDSCYDSVQWADDSECYVWADDTDYVYLSGPSVTVHIDNISDYEYCIDADGDLMSMDDVIYIEETGEYHKPDDCVEDFQGEYILAADATEYETADGETRYALDPEEDPDYRMSDMFAESA